MASKNKRLKVDPNAIRKQVSDSLSQEKCLREKIDEITSLTLTSEADNFLVEAFLVCRFGFRKVAEVASMVSSIKFLPNSVAIQKISVSLGISTEEAKDAFDLFFKVKVFDDNKERFIEPRVITPPTSVCLDCQQQLVQHHPSTDVRIYTLKGFVKGEKWSLRCNGCQTTYNYNKYGSRANGWKLYANERNLVESSDCCYLERKVFDWMGSLRYDSSRIVL
jgi:hypothetical protein